MLKSLPFPPRQNNFLVYRFSLFYHDKDTDQASPNLPIERVAVLLLDGGDIQRRDGPAIFASRLERVIDDS
jgi:hypothetical protein